MNPFLVGDEVHEEEITLGEKTHKVYFREVPHLVYARFVRETQSDDPDERDAAAARFVSRSLCNPDGSLAFTGEEACRLRSSVVNAMVPLIVKVSRAPDAGKPSPPGALNGSGISSHSDSAGDPSGSGRRRSASQNSSTGSPSTSSTLSTTTTGSTDQRP